MSNVFRSSLDGVDGPPLRQPPVAPTARAGSVVLRHAPEDWILVIERLAADNDRRIKWRRLVQSFMETFPTRVSPPRLIEFADEYNWPEWAILSVPSSLGVELPNSSWYLLTTLLPVVEGDCWTVQAMRTLCNGMITCVAVPPHQRAFVRAAAALLDERRTKNPYPSDRALRGSINGALASLTRALKSDRVLKQSQGVEAMLKRATRALDLPCVPG